MIMMTDINMPMILGLTFIVGVLGGFVGGFKLGRLVGKRDVNKNSIV
jgi:hypothetical protein